MDRTRCDRQTERPVPGGCSFGRDEEIGAKTEVIRGEPLSGSPESGHDFVGEDEDAVAPADLVDRLPVPIGWDGCSAGGASDRLRDEDCHVLRACLLDDLVQTVGMKSGAGVGVGWIGAAVLADGRDPHGLSQPGLVRSSQGFPSRHVEGSPRVPVIRGLAGDDHRSLRLTPGEVIGPGHLEGALHRLRSPRDREDSRSIHRYQSGHGLGVTLHWIGGEGRSVHPIDRADLGHHRLSDGGITVADDRGDSPPCGIQILVAVGVGDPCPARRDGVRTRQNAPGEDR